MLLIADSGSTKCDWVLLDENKNEILRTTTNGLNPSVFEMDVLQKRLENNKELTQHATSINKLYFYGAGCGTKTPKKNLQQLFKDFFKNATIDIQEDIVGAVRATTLEAGIVCILGTGSNACYFDGKEIQTYVPSLGYVIMDEASGNYFGKKLLQDYFYEKMPEKLALEFETQFDLDPDRIKINLYKKDQPNAYLASFAAFIFENRKNYKYLNKILAEGIIRFFDNQIAIYKNADRLPIHFVGSIAYLSSEIIHDIAKEFHYTIGTIIQKPIDGLVAYHKQLK